MSKRSAAYELNDRNWDEEDEPEEAGVFAQATASVLKDRQIKKAKRKVGRGDGTTSAGSVFSGFGGFAYKPTKQKTEPITGKMSFSLDKTENASPSNDSPSTSSAKSVAVDRTVNGDGASKSQDSVYLKKLKCLNESVLQWIKTHVEKNPYCVLTPIFRDYEKYLEDLEGSSNNKEVSKSTGWPETSSTSRGLATSTSEKTGTEKEKVNGKGFLSSPAKEISERSTSQKETSVSKESGFNFAFGQDVKKTSTTTSQATPFSGFNFKSQMSDLKPSFTFAASSVSDSDKSKSSVFSFGNPGQKDADSTSWKPGFSFASSVQKASADTEAAANTGNDDDGEYVPPKPETREIKEDGAVYSKRCKLFYQKDKAWKDRGVGNLHLKPLEDGKTQLIIRADNMLGTILLNILLSSSIPVQKQGKNNVFLVCIPNPPIDPKQDGQEPVPMLVRVKTESDAEELLAKIDELKK